MKPVKQKITRLFIHCSPDLSNITKKELSAIMSYLDEHKNLHIFINDRCGVTEKIQNKFVEDKRENITIINSTLNRINNPNKFKVKKFFSKKSGLLAYVERTSLITTYVDILVVVTGNLNEVSTLSVLRKAIARDKTIKAFVFTKKKKKKNTLTAK